MEKKSRNEKKYLSKSPLKQYFLSRFLDVIRDEVAPLAPESVLDAGCGEGYVLEMLKKTLRPGTIFSGCDSSGRAVKIAKERTGADISECNINHLPYGDASAALVLALEVLEHLPDPNSALEELKRVAGDYLIASVPHEPFFSLGNLLAMNNPANLGKDPEHLQFWNKASFADLISRHFRVVSIRLPFPWIVIRAKKYARN